MEFKTPASVPLPAGCGMQPADDDKAVCALMRFDELLADPAVADGGIAPSALNGSNSSSHDDTSASQRSNGSGAPTLPVEPSKKKKRLPVTAADLQSALAEGSGAEEVLCPGGFSVNVYSGNFLEHYAIASEHVVVTRGLVKYVDHHARYGAQTRFRFQLCHNYLLRKCPKLSECSYIHATQLPAPTQVHLNPFAPRRLAADRHGRSDDVAPSVQDDPTVTARYERMPAGTQLRVHPPQGNQVSSEITIVDSGDVFKTRGAVDAVELGGSVTPRHCTRFQYRRACPLGPACSEIHSAVPFDGTRLELTGNTTAALPTAPIQHQLQQPREPSILRVQPQGPAVSVMPPHSLMAPQSLPQPLPIPGYAACAPWTTQPPLPYPAYSGPCPPAQPGALALPPNSVPHIPNGLSWPQPTAVPPMFVLC